jgi:tetratricopeptide (TPR) repeat protein
LEGRYYWNQRSRDGLEKGLALFEKAAEKDPTNALAYAGIADAYNMLLFYGYAPGAVSVLRARSAALKAVELDDSLAEGHAALGYVNFMWIWDWPEAERQFHRAAELNYNYLSGHQWHALYLSAMGRNKEAMEEITIAQKLDPLSRIVNTAAGYIHYYARDYDEAERASKVVLAQDPNFMAAHAVLGLTYEQKRAYPEAIAELQRALDLSGGESPTYIGSLGHAYAASGNRQEAQHAIDKLDDLAKRLPFLGLSSKAVVYAGLDEKEKAFQFLQTARNQNDASMIWIRVQPQFDALRSDPRFQQLLAHQNEGR